jgi:hypothetical protein
MSSYWGTQYPHYPDLSELSWAELEEGMKAEKAQRVAAAQELWRRLMERLDRIESKLDRLLEEGPK